MNSAKGNHTRKTPADKLAILKRANLILTGYNLAIMEKRLHVNVRHLRKWADELNFPFKGAMKPRS
jgi:carbamate kinase